MSKMITLRLSEERVGQLDALVARGAFATRAAALTAALDRLLAEAAAREIDRAIVDGYTRHPPTPEDDDWATWAAEESIREEPW